MGLTMWAQQSLNPPPPDKLQRQIFATLPIIFTIIMAPFPAALIIYWSWNNTLTVAQQYLIMRRQGVTTELDKNVLRLHARFTGKDAPVFEDPNAPKPETPEAISDQSDAKSDAESDGEGAANAAVEAEKPTPSKRTAKNLAAKKRRSPTKKKPSK
jgi:YidC/Oxa1 family membrane protein insertase